MSIMKRWLNMLLMVALFITPLTMVKAETEAPIQSTVSTAAAAPATVYTYTQPTRYAASTNYTLKVNGVEVPVVKAFSDYDYANFSVSEGTVKYEVTILNTDKVHEYGISPKKLGITADSVVGKTLTFTTPKDEYLIVMMNGRATRLVIAADPVEADVPNTTGEGIYNVSEAPYSIAGNEGKTGVAQRTAAIQQAINDASAYGTAAGGGAQGIVYIPRGEYYIGNLVLKSNTAVYMQPGAAFIGTGKTADYTEHWFKDSMGRPATWWISTEFDSENIRIYGRGTIDGNGQALHDDKSTNNKGMINNLVVPIATSNFKMDGVIIRESSAWAVMPVRSNDLEFTNLKMFNSLGMSENDGIDIVESQNAVIRNSIGIALDDPYSTKAWKEDTDIASGKVPWPGNPEPVRNVLFEDAIAWTKCYGFKIGQGVMQDQENITFRDGVVYKAAVGFAVHHKYGVGSIKNVTFENMDVEDISGKNDDNSAWMTMFTVDSGGNGVGPVTGVTVKNITVRDIGESFAKIKGQEGAIFSDLTFENVYMPGKNTPATSLFEMNFTDRAFYQGVTVKPIQNPEPRPQTNLALNRPAVASSNDTAVDTAPFAFDGNLATRFGSKRAVDPGWVYVDLGESKPINEVHLYWEGAYGKSYQIQVSNDAQNWTSVYSTTTGKGAVEKIPFTQTSARYVRMYGTVRATQYGYSIWEFEVYGPEVLTDSITLNKTELALYTGQSEQLTATIAPEAATNKYAKWTSSNANIAVVNSSGLVTAVGPGTATIRAVTSNGEFTASATIIVKAIGKAVLNQINVGDGEALLSWSGVEGATGYQIFMSNSAGSYHAALDSVSDSVYSYKAVGLTNGNTYYFVVKAVHPAGDSAASNEVSATPQASAPGAPILTSVHAGDAKATLDWEPVDGSTGYQIFKTTVSGAYDIPAATVSSNVYSYEALGLNNGTMYYFVVKASNTGGISAASNEVGVTPSAPTTIPEAPTQVTAIASDGYAMVSFQPPAHNGGSPITHYEVTSSPGSIVATGTTNTITVTGLTNGTTYTFTVKAINSIGASDSSNASNAVVPAAVSSETPDNGDSDTSAPPAPPSPPVKPDAGETPAGVSIELGLQVTTELNGQRVTKVTVDPNKLEEVLAAEGERGIITIPVDTKSDIVIGELNGQMLKLMEQKQAAIEIKTGQASYSLPAEQINIDSILSQLGGKPELQHIFIRIEIAQPTSETEKTVENAASSGNFTLVTAPLHFTVKAVYGEITIDISKFTAYVERTIALPDGVNPDSTMTGVVIDADGTVRHVPTKIVQVDGKYVAKVSSLTNSTYSVIRNPLQFKDLEGHWAMETVNNMGSRMIITGVSQDQFNPDQAMTRAEFAAIIVRGLGVRLENGEAPFSDVSTSDWYSSAVHTAHSFNLISGYEDGTFKPLDFITREQAMTIMSKVIDLTGLGAKLPSVDLSTISSQFEDWELASEWARSRIVDCLLGEIITGRHENQLSPQAWISRAEVAVMLHRLLQNSALI